MELTGERVVLRVPSAFRREDWVRLQRHFRDPEIAYFNGSRPIWYPRWLLAFMLRGDERSGERYTFGIYDEHDDFIGLVELYYVREEHATLGIIIGEHTHWSRGYGPDAVHTLLTYGFYGLQLDRVYLQTYGDNIRAQRAFGRVGFKETRRVNARRGRVEVHMVITEPQLQIPVRKSSRALK